MTIYRSYDLLLKRYAPASILITSDGDVLSWFGTAAAFVDTMNNLADSTSSLRKFADAPQAVADAFSEKSCLKGVTYCNDDRMYRHVLVGDSAKEINFHYSALSFDFCFLEISFSTRLCVKISGLTEDDLLYTTSPFVGPNTAFYSEDEDSWVSHTIPAPVLFKKTNETAKSNIGVIYSQNGE